MMSGISASPPRARTAFSAGIDRVRTDALLGSAIAAVVRPNCCAFSFACVERLSQASEAARYLRLPNTKIAQKPNESRKKPNESSSEPSADLQVNFQRLNTACSVTYINGSRSASIELLWTKPRSSVSMRCGRRAPLGLWFSPGSLLFVPSHARL